MVTTGTEEKFLELCFLRFGHRCPLGPSLTRFFCSDFSPFDFDDHRKVVPGADPRLIQVPGRTTQVLWAHDLIKLFFANPRAPGSPRVELTIRPSAGHGAIEIFE